MLDQKVSDLALNIIQIKIIAEKNATTSVVSVQIKRS